MGLPYARVGRPSKKPFLESKYHYQQIGIGIPGFELSFMIPALFSTLFAEHDASKAKASVKDFIARDTDLGTTE